MTVREAQLAALVISRDHSLIDLMQLAAGPAWTVESGDGPASGRDLFDSNHYRIVLIDDAVVSEGDRAWLLRQIGQSILRPFVIYVAAAHTAEVEKRARAGGALYYTSKPVESEQFLRVLRGFAAKCAPSPAAPC